MKAPVALAIAVLAGFALGAVSIEGLRAQAKPPVYFVAEIDVKDPERYAKEFAPLAQANAKKHGGRFLAASSKPVGLEGEPPKSRVVIQVWDSMEKLQGWRNSPEQKAAREIGEKYATFRQFAVEGVPQQ